MILFIEYYLIFYILICYLNATELWTEKDESKRIAQVCLNTSLPPQKF